MAGLGQLTAPTTTTQTSTTGNPLQPTYLPAPPTVNANLSPAQAEQQLTSANALTNAQGDNNLNNLLASEGITGNDATAAIGALGGQQIAAEAPSLASLITNSQNNNLQQGEFNAGTTVGTNQFNANAANTSGQDLATLLMQNYGLDLNAVLGVLGTGQAGGNTINSTGESNQLGLNNSTANAQNNQSQNNWNDLALAFGA
jgi:hypothetical protein